MMKAAKPGEEIAAFLICNHQTLRKYGLGCRGPTYLGWRRPGIDSVKSRGILSIEVGGRLLEALARVGEPMMLRDLAREAGMTPAKAHPLSRHQPGNSLREEKDPADVN